MPASLNWDFLTRRDGVTRCLKLLRPSGASTDRELTIAIFGKPTPTAGAGTPAESLEANPPVEWKTTARTKQTAGITKLLSQLASPERDNDRHINLSSESGPIVCSMPPADEQKSIDEDQNALRIRDPANG